MKAHRRPGCRVAILLLLALGSARSWAQQSTPSALSGSVVDAATSERLPGVNVFVAGTTLGAATDQAGQFHIPLPAQHQFDVVASMVGYQVETRSLSSDALPEGGLVFRLQPIRLELNAVEVVAERPEAWAENLARFSGLLFSRTSYGEQCELVNPEILELTYDEATDALEASASEPLLIDNHALGYRITMHAPSLVSAGGRVQWGGKLQFSELEGGNARARRRWVRNRQRAYQGSTRHFLAALAAGHVAEEGFGAYYVSRPGDTSTGNPIDEMGLQWEDQATSPLLEDGPAEAVRTLRFSGFLYVTYVHEGEPREYVEIAYRNPDGSPPRRLATRPTQSSWLTLLNGFTRIDTQGNEYSAYSMKQYGYWAWERLGEQLPYDYRPDS